MALIHSEASSGEARGRGSLEQLILTPSKSTLSSYQYAKSPWQKWRGKGQNAHLH